MTLAHYTNKAPKQLSAVLKHEAAFGMSRTIGTVLAGSGAPRVILLGAVCAAQLFGTPAIDNTGNTGTGALGSLTLGAKAKAGDYVVTCVAEAAGGGRFQVVDPDGYALPDAVVGAAYVHPQLNFTIADGDPDFVVGDAFTITVPAGTGKVVALAPGAVDGTQRVFGIALEQITAPDGADKDGQFLARDGVVADTELAWPDGITSDQKSAALAELAAANIQVRTAG